MAGPVLVHLFLAVASIAAVAPHTPAHISARVPVYVRVASSADGWVPASSELSDSARDIQRVLATADTWKAIRPAEGEDDARVILEVTERTRQSRTLIVRARLRVGDYETTVDATGDVSFTSWRDLARRVVEKTDAWAVANHARLAR